MSERCLRNLNLEKAMKSTEIIHQIIEKYGSDDNREFMNDLLILKHASRKEVEVVFRKAINNALIIISES
jgi:hypothetical protein